MLDQLAEAGYRALYLLGAGHRVVHGGERFTASIRVDESVIAAVRSFSHLAPLHNPANLAGIEAVRVFLPDLPQVAVFDTAFHQTMPRTRLPLRGTRGVVHRARGATLRVPRHQSPLRQRAGRDPARPVTRELRLVTAHLGNGCSATAVRDGVSVDTTMGLTPLDGLVMGTRSGDVDPGAARLPGRHGPGWMSASSPRR